MDIIGALFAQLGGWSWWVIGLLLLGLEILAPGSFFIWFGIAAILTGTVELFAHWSWQGQLLLFLVLSVVLVIGGRRYFAQPRPEEGAANINERSAQLLGVTSVLTEPIVDGRGRIRIDDTTWRVTGPDLPVGSRVSVVAADGPVLKVAPARPT
ncbi:MAG: NfeD family protein [Bauldia sp.]